MWYKLTEKDPPESTSMNTVLFPVWFHGGLCLARKIGGEININGSPSNFADEVEWWYELTPPKSETAEAVEQPLTPQGQNAQSSTSAIA